MYLIVQYTYISIIVIYYDHHGIRSFDTRIFYMINETRTGNIFTIYTGLYEKKNAIKNLSQSHPPVLCSTYMVFFVFFFGFLVISFIFYYFNYTNRPFLFYAYACVHPTLFVAHDFIFFYNRRPKSVLAHTLSQSTFSSVMGQCQGERGALPVKTAEIWKIGEQGRSVAAIYGRFAHTSLARCMAARRSDVYIKYTYYVYYMSVRHVDYFPKTPSIHRQTVPPPVTPHPKTVCVCHPSDGVLTRQCNSSIRQLSVCHGCNSVVFYLCIYHILL